MTENKRDYLPQCRFCDNFNTFCRIGYVHVEEGNCASWTKNAPFQRFGTEHLARMLGELQDAVDEIRTMLAVAGKTPP